MGVVISAEEQTGVNTIVVMQEVSFPVPAPHPYMRRQRQQIRDQIVIFSPHRFSDWCVHEASSDELLHLAALERLRF